MKKPEFRIIKKQTWQMLTSDTLWNVWSLLDATRALVDSNMEKNRAVLVQDLTKIHQV